MSSAVNVGQCAVPRLIHGELRGQVERGKEERQIGYVVLPEPETDQQHQAHRGENQEPQHQQIHRCQAEGLKRASAFLSGSDRSQEEGG